MKKRSLALLLTLAMCLSLVTIPVQGTDVPETGIEGYVDSGYMENGLYWVTTVNANNKHTMTIKLDPNRSDKDTLVVTKASWVKDNALREIILEDGVKGIAERGFDNNDGVLSGVQTIRIPASVESIGRAAFYECGSLCLVVDENNPNYCSDDNGILYDKNKETLLHCSYTATYKIMGENNHAFTVPAVKTIAPYAFTTSTGNYSVRKLTIPTSVTRIDDYACSGLVELSEIIFESGQGDPLTIGNCAFMCTRMQRITLPGRLTELGEEAFNVNWNNNNSNTWGMSIGSSDTVPLTLHASCIKVNYTPGSSSSTVQRLFLELGKRPQINVTSKAKSYISDAIYTIESSNVMISYGGTAADWRSAFHMEPLLGVNLWLTKKPWVFQGSKGGLRLSFDNNNPAVTVSATDNYGKGVMYPILCTTGESVPLPAPITFEQGITAGFVTPAGGSFLGWRIGDKFYQPGDSYTISENTTAYAVWFEDEMPGYYSVSLDPNGGAALPAGQQTIRVKPGETYGTLPTPTRVGYDFAGWYTDGGDAGTLVSAQTTVPESVKDGTTTLYAHWTPHMYTVTFQVGQGETVSPTTLNVAYQAAYGELPTPVKAGYTFGHWYYQDGQEQTEILGSHKYTYTKDITLQPTWTANTYTVTFDPAGGALPEGTAGSVSVQYGAKYPELPIPTHTDEYKLFAGWFTAAEGGKQVASGADFQSAGDQTLYAHWTDKDKPSHTIALDAAGGSVSPATVTVYETGVYGALPVPQRSGYAFDGWFTAADGGKQVTAETVVALGSESASQTLYAHWVKTYVVTLDPGEGTVETSALTVRTGGTYGDLPVPVRADYTFQGWYTAPTGGSRITASSVVTLTGDVTLFARWKTARTKFTITLDANGGYFTVGGSAAPQTTKELDVSASTAYGPLPAPKREGYTFAGWFTAPESGAGEQITSDTEFTLWDDQTLYARWLEDSDALKTLGYSFPNTHSGFGYYAGYKFPYARFKRVFGNTALARRMYEIQGAWGGSCHGMVTTAALFHAQDNGVNVDDFERTPLVSETLALISELGPDYTNLTWDRMSVRSFIEAMQINGFSSVIQRGGGNDLDTLAQAVQAFETGSAGAGAVEIAVYDRMTGHALLAYRYEKLGDTNGRIYVYDCNHPGDHNRYVSLDRSQAGGGYTKWSYGGYHGPSNDYRLSYYVLKREVPDWLSDAADKTKSATTTESVDANMELLTVNSADITLYGADGSQAAKLTGGVLTGNQDVSLLYRMEDGPQGEAEEETLYGLWLPVGLYTVVNDDPAVEHFQASMTHVMQGSGVTTDGTIVTFAVDDGGEGERPATNYVQLPEPDTHYTILLEQAPARAGEPYLEWQAAGTVGKSATAFANLPTGLHVRGTAPDMVETRENADQYSDIELDDYIREDGTLVIPEEKQVPAAPVEVAWDPVSGKDAPQPMPENIGAVTKETTVTFQPNGGSGEQAAAAAAVGAPMILPVCSFNAPAGQKFKAWAVGAPDGARYAPGDTYMVTGETVFYAVWEEAGGASSGGETDSDSGSDDSDDDDSGSGSGSSSGSGGSKGGTSAGKPSGGKQSVTNKDGSVTTTSTDKKTGTVTETTVFSDGTTRQTERRKDGTEVTTVVDKAGSVTTTTKSPEKGTVVTVLTTDGSSSTAVTTADEKTVTQVTLSPSAVEQAVGQGQSVVLPVLPVAAAADWKAAAQVTVELPASVSEDAPVWVAVPVADPQSGLVAVLAHADGTTEVLRDSLVTGQATVNFPMSRSATILIVDNHKVFTDVEGHWAVPAIDFVTSREIFNGMTDTLFAPDLGFSRAMLVQVLYNLEGRPATAAGSPFPDVPEGRWYTQAVVWAAGNGIVTGFEEDGTFRPEDPVTREQTAVIFYRYARSRGLKAEQVAQDRTYTDAEQISNYAVDALGWMTRIGVLSGYSDGSFAPAGKTTRGEAATILRRFCEATGGGK